MSTPSRTKDDMEAVMLGLREMDDRVRLADQLTEEVGPVIL